MMRSLRVQLLVSHLSIVALMVAVMAGSVASFLHLSRSIDRIFKDNYKSVLAAQDMKQAIERQDSAAAFYLGGQVEKARSRYEANAVRFQTALATASGNVTEPGEKPVLEDIERQFETYRTGMRTLLYADPPLSRSEARALYAGKLEPAFEQLDRRSQDVLDLNQAAILRADRTAKDEARRASRTSIAVTAAAFFLALFFALRMIRASLTPLLLLAGQAEEIGAGHLETPLDLHRTDEVGALATSFNRMRERLREARHREEQRLHRAERMSDEALESLYDPVVVTDAAGGIVHLNPAAEELFGPSPKAVGRPVETVVPDPRIADAIWRAVRQSEVSAGESEADYIPLRDGDMERIFRLRATPMHDDDGSVLGAVAVLEDVTHLRALDRLKNEFIGVASHELRTPVTSLLLSVELLEQDMVGPLTPEQREVVAAQRQDMERLLRMMRDLLDVTRLEAGMEPPHLALLDAKKLLESAVATVMMQAEAKGVTLSLNGADVVLTVRADRAQITRVLVNLLNNAVRHTPKGGHINARVDKCPAGVTFRVEDTGVGIPEEHLPRIFERFVQVPGATRGGAGLGLSIAQTIVKAHGGCIAAESEVGKGSTFTVTLPSAAETLPDGGKE